MSGKMNWDRVNKEKLAQEHGSEWVEPESNSSSQKTRKKKKARNQQKLKGRRILAIKSLNPNCTCGKLRSFKGLHRLSCPSRSKSPQPYPKPTNSTPPPPSRKPEVRFIQKYSQEEFLRTMSDLHTNGKLAKWLRLARKQVASDKSLLAIEKLSTINKIDELLEKL